MPMARCAGDGQLGGDEEAAGGNANLIDLGGRTVIPGLTDGHIHGVRAALTFGTEVNWIGVPTLKEALERIHQAAKTQKPGSWIVVAGGWTEEQFSGKRRADRKRSGSGMRRTIQFTSSTSMTGLLLKPKVMETLNIRDDADVTPGGGRLERDGNNRPTGAVTAEGSALGKIFDRLPCPTPEQQARTAPGNSFPR